MFDIIGAPPTITEVAAKAGATMSVPAMAAETMSFEIDMFIERLPVAGHATMHGRGEIRRVSAKDARPATFFESWSMFRKSWKTFAEHAPAF
jgi:hypothetical protein